MKHLHRLLAFAFMLSAGPLLAQHRPMGPPHGPKKERMEALRVAFFTEALELTAEDAEVFWPVMRTHQEELESLRTSLDSLRDVAANPENLSREQALECLEAVERLQAEECAAKSALLRAIAETLDPQRALQIPLIEDNFRRRIFEEVQNRRTPTSSPGRRPHR